jgi:hypothetical protein
VFAPADVILLLHNKIILRINKMDVAETIATPMTDLDIKEYLPDARILKYSELSKYHTLDEMLPEQYSYVILLYEDSPNKGHWVCVSKPDKKTVEYFDSYGGIPDAPLKWTPKQRRIGMGAGEPLLGLLFDKAPEKVVYNKIHYQNEGQGVNDCGRWCCLRVITMKKGMKLAKFYDFIRDKAKQFHTDHYDVVVAKLIP